MTITIETPEALAEIVTQDAERAGMSIQEYTLRALAEKATGREKVSDESQKPKITREQARARLQQRIASGFYANRGLSSDALIADRREEVRREAEADARRDAERETRS